MNGQKQGCGTSGCETESRTFPLLGKPKEATEAEHDRAPLQYCSLPCETSKKRGNQSSVGNLMAVSTRSAIQKEGLLAYFAWLFGEKEPQTSNRHFSSSGGLYTHHCTLKPSSILTNF